MEKTSGNICSNFNLDMNIQPFDSVMKFNEPEVEQKDFAAPVQEDGNQDDSLKKIRPKRRKRRTRRRRPGNRKRKFPRRHLIPRSSLGAPFLCNDMLMAKDGWVFDKSSGKIEFKPEVTLISHEGGEGSRPSDSQYILISPERISPGNARSHHSTCFNCNSNSDDVTLPAERNVASPPMTNCDSGFASPSPQGKESLSMIEHSQNTSSSSYDQSLSVLCDSDEDFKFHMQNFEEDTDQYLRESLMALSREDLEAQYHSSMQKLHNLQSCTDANNNFAVCNSFALLDQSPAVPYSTNVCPDLLSQGIETLQELTSTIASRFQDIQLENVQLKQENHRIRLALDT